jgi:hypothetical protein
MLLNAESTAFVVETLPSDVEVVVPVLHLVDRGDDLVDVERRLVEVALRGEGDLGGVAILRDQVRVAAIDGRLDLRELGKRLERVGHVGDDSLEARIVDLQRVGLDQDDLAHRVFVVREACLDDLVCLLGLADGEVAVFEELGAERAADDDGRNDKREPAEDGGLPVARTPATHPGREVVRMLERGQFGSLCEWGDLHSQRPFSASRRRCGALVSLRAATRTRCGTVRTGNSPER